MTTYEENVMEVYYNLKNYFTIKNIIFPAVEKRTGGRGRGEIDLLAVKISNDKVIDAIHVEVSVSVSSAFPFKSDTSIGQDESKRLIKKFFETDHEHKIKEFLGDTIFRRQLISSYLDNKSKDRLKERLEKFGAIVISLDRVGHGMKLTLSYNGKQKTIEIIPFPEILKEVVKIFHDEDLLGKNFQDERLRALQYLAVNYKK